MDSEPVLDGRAVAVPFKAAPGDAALERAVASGDAALERAVFMNAVKIILCDTDRF